MNKKINIGMLGLGYVGLPLAIAFAKKFQVIGFDKSETRISELKNNFDKTFEVSKNILKKTKNLYLTSKRDDLKNCNVYIITVPTPIDAKKKPNLLPLISACKTVSTILKKKDFVIFESTVYPGLTEEVCIPIIEKKTQFKLNKEFYVGYSPERINPGDKKHKLGDIIKITSGSNYHASKFVDNLYKKIVPAGTFMTTSIKVAEAAKIIENTQRDLNIALMNELSHIFNKLKIDTKEVIDAAGTKWNFNKFYPGLVGGHCIGVDPYYLTYKSNQIKYKPKIILAGRKINDSMHKFVFTKLKKKMKEKKLYLPKSKLLVMGLTFKENCPDFRNSKSFQLIKLLLNNNFFVDVHDPYINYISLKYTKLNIINKFKKNYYDSIIILTPHDYYKKIGITKIKTFAKNNSIIFDVKSLFDKSKTDLRL